MKNRKTKIHPAFIFLIIIFAVCGIVILSFYKLGSSNKQDIEKNLDEVLEIPKNIQDDFLNVNEIHWGHMPLTYKIENENECNLKLKNRIEEAFETIQLETDGVVAFEKTDENPDIEVFCKPYNYRENSGELGELSSFDIVYADSIFDTDYNNKNLIIKSTINFYGAGLICETGYPAIEVHQIMKSFGFGNEYKINDVMRPEVEEKSLNCKVEGISEEHINCLKYIYSNGELGNSCSGLNFIE